jgi:phosphohistidine phosphatase
MQHGVSVSKEENPERPLSDQGKNDVEKMAAFLQKLGIPIVGVYHSGKTRARQTAEFVVSRFDPDVTLQKKAGLSPMDNASETANEIRAGDKDIMIVGHLPHLAKLTSLLVVGDETVPVVSFQQGGVVCLEEVEGGDWSIAWMLVPEIMLQKVLL